MALVLADRVQETSTTTGTGTITLAGALTGFQSFVAGVGDTNTTYYTITDGLDWEVGIGTVGVGTLSRDTILASSNAGLAVNFSVGTKQVFVTYPADKSVNTEDIGVSVQAYDATILTDSDIGVSVQAYDATILTDSDIGVSVQAYDADTTKNDVSNTFTENQQIAAALKAENYYESVGTITASSLDLSTGNVFSSAPASSPTYVFNNPPATGTAYGFTLKVTPSATVTITWAASVEWPDGTAPTAPASGETSIYVFYTQDGGTTYYGFISGEAMA